METNQSPIAEKTPYNLGVTFAIGIGAFIVFLITQNAGICLSGLSRNGRRHPDGFDLVKQLSDPASEFMKLVSDGNIIAWMSIISSFLTGGFILLFIKFKKGWTIREYLNLGPINLKQLGFWMGIMLLYLIPLEFITGIMKTLSLR